MTVIDKDAVNENKFSFGECPRREKGAERVSRVIEEISLSKKVKLLADLTVIDKEAVNENKFSFGDCPRREKLTSEFLGLIE